MTDPPPPERRRARRRAPSSIQTMARIKMSIQARVVDVSRAGVQLELPVTVKPGSVYDMKAILGGVPVSALIRVTRCRAQSQTDASGNKVIVFRAGASFERLDADRMPDLEQWLDKSTSLEQRDREG